MIENIPLLGETISTQSLLNNPIVAGVLVLYILGIVSFLLRGVPGKMLAFFQRWYIVSLTFNNDDYENKKLMNAFMKWFFSNGFDKHSRAFTLNELQMSIDQVDTDPDAGNDEQRIYQRRNSSNVLERYGATPGDGLHRFWYRGRLYWFTYNQAEIKTRMVYNISLKTFGRSPRALFDLVEEFRPEVKPPKDIITHLIYNWGSWDHAGELPKRDFNSLAINPELKEKIIDDIENFFNDPDWYIKNALPYKLTMLLSGPPGTGKTSLAKVIASHYNRTICSLNLGQCSDLGFATAVANMPPRSVLLIEDFDSVANLQRRGIDLSDAGNQSAWKKMRYQAMAQSRPHGTLKAQTNGRDVESDETLAPERRTGPPDNPNYDSSISLSGVLNTLDGAQSLHGHIIILTTNSLGTVDEAVYRPGRVDYMYEIKHLTDDVIREYSNRVFPNFDFSKYTFLTQPGCNLHQALIGCRRDPKKYVDLLWTADEDHTIGVEAIEESA